MRRIALCPKIAVSGTIIWQTRSGLQTMRQTSFEAADPLRAHWPYHAFVWLFGVGVSSVGDFVYLVALNLFVLRETHSAAAVASIWVVGRVAALIVGPWAGSVTDRIPRRGQLIGIEMARAGLVGVLPLVSNIAAIDGVLFLLGACGTFFSNALLPYQTMLVPTNHRKRVNSMASMLRSGAFLIGPAIAGLLLARGNTATALWLDATSFLVSSLTFVFLPTRNPPPVSAGDAPEERGLRADWREAVGFLRANPLYTRLFALNATVGVLAMTADSQEVVFAQNALHLGAFGYGMMVFAAGVGFVSGSLILIVISKRVRTEWLIGVGRPLAAIGYLSYAFSHSFWWAAGSLTALGLFGSAASVGLTTYTQNIVPVSRMGRVANVLGPPQQILAIAFILAGGVLAAKYGVRALMIGVTVPMAALGLTVAATVYWNAKRARQRPNEG